MRDSISVSVSPFGDRYAFERLPDDRNRIDHFMDANDDKQVVVIQGLGFVGTAMMAAVSLARKKDGSRQYATIGIDLPMESSYWKVGRINEGLVPVTSSDISLEKAYHQSFQEGNIMATTDPYVYEIAGIVVVDTNLDVHKDGLGNGIKREVDLTQYKQAIELLAKRIKPSCLVVVETTLPPGTCGKVILPILESGFRSRGLSEYPVNLAYSYERVMPGRNYLNSIISYYRVFSAANDSASRKAREFLGSFIDTQNYPLVELDSMIAAEMAKVLENTYRATNIALIQEWAEFAEYSGVDLFQIIEAIRMRETHKNIMLPGFGVGGYCLTKDPLLADWGYCDLNGSGRHFHMSVDAVDVNDLMPLHSFELLRRYVGDLNGKRLLIMGVSYTKGIADTRSSPTELFHRQCRQEGAEVFLHDPTVEYWKEQEIHIETDLRECRFQDIDAVIMTVAHDEYVEMTANELFELTGQPGLILDTNNVIDDLKASSLRELGCQVAGVGKGHWNKFLERNDA